MRVVLRQARSLGGRSLRNRARGRLTDIRTCVPSRAGIECANQHREFPPRGQGRTALTRIERGMYHAALRVHVREVQQAVRIDHDFLGAGERRGEMPQVPEFEGRAALQWSRSADVEEELSVRDMKCPGEPPRLLD